MTSEGVSLMVSGARRGDLSKLLDCRETVAAMPPIAV